MSGNRMTPAAFLAMELRSYREAAKMTQEEQARRLSVSMQLVSHWETGARLLRPEHAKRFDALHETGGIVTRMLTELVSTVGAPEWMGRWLEVECDATLLCSLQPTAIDGLLQTEDYAQAILSDRRFHLADVEEAVAARIDRQQVLTREGDPPILIVVMAETVLRQIVGAPDVMHEQLKHLAHMAERENIAVQIVPFSAPAGGTFTSPFILATVGGKELAYVDNQLSADVVDDPPNVAMVRRMFEAFRKSALSPEDSLALIKKVAEEWNQ